MNNPAHTAVLVRAPEPRGGQHGDQPCCAGRTLQHFCHNPNQTAVPAGAGFPPLGANDRFMQLFSHQKRSAAGTQWVTSQTIWRMYFKRRFKKPLSLPLISNVIQIEHAVCFHHQKCSHYKVYYVLLMQLF